MKRGRILMLVAAALLWACIANAIPLDRNAADGIAGIYLDGGALFAIGTDGQAWVLVLANVDGWLPTTWPSLPEGVGIEDVADWSTRFVTTYNGVRWQYNTDPTIMGWVQVPSLPSAPVPARARSLGDVKGLYR